MNAPIPPLPAAPPAAAPATPRPAGPEGEGPRLLVVSTQPWTMAARLAGALAQAGCVVEAASPPHALLARSGAPRAHHRLHPWRLRRDLATALRRARPDRVLPADDAAAALLATLRPEPDLAALVEASLGAPESTAVAHSKTAQMALAARLGLPVPETRPVESLPALLAALAESGLPRVLKADGSWGGTGVTLLREAAAAPAAYAAATTRPSLLQTAKLAAWEGSLRPFAARRAWRRPALHLQAFIAGPPANRAVLAERGRVLAGLSVEVLTTLSPTGPGSVVRVIDHPQMAATAAAMAARLGLSGLLGFDFVLEAGTGRALLLEMNPRATPICHLSDAPGGGLAGALAAHLAGRDPAAVPLPAPGTTIALFPSEWLRDPASPWLREARHDVPWHDAPLLRAYMEDAAALRRFERRRAWLRRLLGRPPC
ncbi:hypothetical protein NON00_03160 [Roseomonas sp. GC11]|uniref:hypothetical protein n=1 Tax=Roseomonas sp. GC11 TaxID=2950546 RepID=UPI00210D7B2B|nr:hypothetical protein [Roseomonas sp. GC11]MCQ4158922.1 hypothetical protein [Roseomonas sp. GC11]